MENDLLWVGLLFGIIVSVALRFSGVAVSGKINPEGPLFRWIQSVAYAMLAALVARMVVFPTGPLEETELWHRITAAIFAVGIFYFFKLKLLLAVGAGTFLFIIFQYI